MVQLHSLIDINNKTVYWIVCICVLTNDEMYQNYNWPIVIFKIIPYEVLEM